MEKRDPHPLTQYIPVAAQLPALVEDIKQNGLREPIVLHEGRIIEGRVRYQAALAVGVEPQFSYWDRGGR